MRSNFNETTYFLPVPILTFGFFVFIALYINNSYFIDPDYVYLINGLNIVRGESYSIFHVDHPGTPLQILIGIFIAIIGTLRGAENLTIDVLNNPQLYIKIIIVCIAFFHSYIVFLIGKKFYKHQKNRTDALVIQLSFLLYVTVTTTFMKLFTDMIIPSGSLLIVLITIERVWGKMNDSIYAILSSIISGVFIAIKITFLPIVIIPFIITSKWKNKILIPVLTTIIFFLSILPVIDKFIHFKSFILKIATHEGTYGSGSEEFINIPKQLNNIWNSFQVEYTFTIIFIVQVIFLLFVFYKNRFQSFKNKYFLVSFALFVNIILQLFIVSKHFDFRYLAPSLTISAFAFSIILIQLKSSRVLYYFIILMVSISSLYYNYKMIYKAAGIKSSRDITYSFINNTIKSDDAVLVVTEDSWFGSPFKSHSLMYGKSYCYHEGEQYDAFLEEIYPNQYFLSHNNQQYNNWHISIMPDLLLNHYKKLYIYIQTDNPSLYPGVIDDFTINLKYDDLNSVNSKLIFSNPGLGEEIFLIDLQDPKTITPNIKILSSFEQDVDNPNNYIVSANDSIYFKNCDRLSEHQSFEGKNSICISPDNPYGIANTISQINQHDYIRISIMCKRSSKLNECCIGLKSFIPEDGFMKIGNKTVETIEGWDKLEYSYRFQHTPAEHKVIMFIWNNSNEPVYFDNLKVEVY